MCVCTLWARCLGLDGSSVSSLDLELDAANVSDRIVDIADNSESEGSDFVHEDDAKHNDDVQHLDGAREEWSNAFKVVLGFSGPIDLVARSPPRWHSVLWHRCNNPQPQLVARRRNKLEAYLFR